ncbi:MAG TPA: PEP/pyruvate-binding domain-containing protein [Vicinamibacteria bacterium]|nr:PEP/pyruvate-binding domain-containing protein [Vicinamibacteria bacterium]
MHEERALGDVLHALQERAKELSCLYRVDEILARPGQPVDEALRHVVAALPSGWQYPAVCQARIVVGGHSYEPTGYAESAWAQSAPIQVHGRGVGNVSVSYTAPRPPSDEGPFLKEERRLIDTIADRLSRFLEQREPRPEAQEAVTGGQGFRAVLELLRATDQNLHRRIARKMLNHLAWSGVGEARELLLRHSAERSAMGDDNRPTARSGPEDFEATARETFRIAAAQISETEISALVQVWIREDRVDFLVQALETPYTSLVEIGNALDRFARTGVATRDLSIATQVGLGSALVRRLLTEDQDAINRARRYVQVEDFLELVSRTVLLPRSHGHLGGKASGLFLAERILRRSPEYANALEGIRVPRTWHLPSDGILHFVAYNDLDEVYSWKYRDIDQIRQEYPHILQLFKNSRFPPEIEHGVARALDDLGDAPLIVRSSSLLEDRAGSAFSGKYKSLFLANRGDKDERLAALLDAIAEVYASTFSPDPIQYRSERGLLEHHEEMAVMIQPVVGTRVGRYFLPAFSGVGFSNNELRWSPRIRREDGLLRLVPGLGTRAVDRLADDYPVLAAPGQPGLRVNASPEDVARYSPKRVDVIDLATNRFETMELRAFLRECGHEWPALRQLVSVYEGDRLRRATSLGPDFEREDVVVTFEGLLADTSFLARMQALLKLLGEGLATPVDVEFASDGRDLYLLQCRPQSSAAEDHPAPVPRDVPPASVVFSAHRHVSNGAVPDITHIVYVDPEGYSRLSNPEALRQVARAVGAANKLLPKRQFILMGPGRWGSRGDVRLGVGVTYADISNAAMLIEIARQKGNYVPDLSFGTHFFQDLVESQIRYLPLYPDDPGVAFAEAFLRRAESVLTELLPAFAPLADTVRVIDVPRATGGQVLKVAMNADLNEALGFLAAPGSFARRAAAVPARAAQDDEHWRWRLRMAERIGADLDPARFGVKALYVYGSTKNATAGPGSDLDLIVHFAGDETQRRELLSWLQGWSQALAEMNYLRTGYRSAGLLDVVLVSDEDIRRQTSYACKIGAVTDAARPLALGAPAG